MKKETIKAYGYLKTDSIFSEIFPGGSVPLKSTIPVIPSEDGAPHCYAVDTTKLSDHQITLFAKQLYQAWKPKCQSLDQAIAWVQAGLLLDIKWFTGAGNDYRMLG